MAVRGQPVSPTILYNIKRVVNVTRKVTYEHTSRKYSKADHGLPGHVLKLSEDPDGNVHALTSSLCDTGHMKKFRIAHAEQEVGSEE